MNKHGDLPSFPYRNHGQSKSLRDHIRNQRGAAAEPKSPKIGSFVPHGRAMLAVRLRRTQCFRRRITSMATQLSPSGSKPLRVSVVAIPEAAASTLFGIVDVMQAFAFMGIASTHTGMKPPF